MATAHAPVATGQQGGLGEGVAAPSPQHQPKSQPATPVSNPPPRNSMPPPAPHQPRNGDYDYDVMNLMVTLQREVPLAQMEDLHKAVSTIGLEPRLRVSFQPHRAAKIAEAYHALSKLAFNVIEEQARQLRRQVEEQNRHTVFQPVIPNGPYQPPAGLQNPPGYPSPAPGHGPGPGPVLQQPMGPPAPQHQGFGIINMRASFAQPFPNVPRPPALAAPGQSSEQSQQFPGFINMTYQLPQGQQRNQFFQAPVPPQGQMAPPTPQQRPVSVPVGPQGQQLTPSAPVPPELISTPVVPSNGESSAAPGRISPPERNGTPKLKLTWKRKAEEAAVAANGNNTGKVTETPQPPQTDPVPEKRKRGRPKTRKDPPNSEPRPPKKLKATAPAAAPAPAPVPAPSPVSAQVRTPSSRPGRRASQRAVEKLKEVVYPPQEIISSSESSPEPASQPENNHDQGAADRLAATMAQVMEDTDSDDSSSSDEATVEKAPQKGPANGKGPNGWVPYSVEDFLVAD